MGGIAEWVCCPGELNTPLLTALACCSTLHRWQVQDERTAGYFALGRMQATGRGVGVVLGNAGNAGAVLPAVIESYYERRPMILLTLDDERPTEGTGRYGRIAQEGLFGRYAPTMTLPMPCSFGELPDMEEICSDGFPVHLRLCCTEAIHTERVTDPPEVADIPARARFRGKLAGLAHILRFEAGRDGMVLILGALDPEEQESALWLARTLRVPVLADATSGLREKVGSLLFTGGEEYLTEVPPKFVLRVGAIPSSPFWRALEDMPDTHVFSITRSGFSGLRRPSTLIEGEPEQVVRALDDVPRVGDPADYRAIGRRLDAKTEEFLLNYPESDAALVRAFSQYACSAEVICLGSPSVTMLWNKYAQRQVPTFYVRSADLAGGTDGALSAFFGNCADASFACAFIGDIALLRDTSAAQLLPQLSPGKRVIAVLNNDGAGLSPTDSDPGLRNLLSQPLTTDLREFARIFNAEYYVIRSEADFEVIEGLADDALALLDVSPDPEQTTLNRCLPHASLPGLAAKKSLHNGVT